MEDADAALASTVRTFLILRLEPLLTTLDQYLLTRRDADAVLRHCLDCIRASPWSPHLQRCGLDGDLPENRTDLWQRLLRLRLLFAYEPDPSSELLLHLGALCDYCDLALRHAGSDPREFERDLRKVRPYSAEDPPLGRAELGLLTGKLREALALAQVPPDRRRGLTVDLNREVLNFLNRCLSYWRALLGTSPSPDQLLIHRLSLTSTSAENETQQ